MLHIEVWKTIITFNKPKIMLLTDSTTLDKLVEEQNYLTSNFHFEDLALMSLLDRYEICNLENKCKTHLSLANEYIDLEQAKQLTMNEILNLRKKPVTEQYITFFSLFWFDLKTFLPFFKQRHTLRKIEQAPNTYWYYSPSLSELGKNIYDTSRHEFKYNSLLWPITLEGLYNVIHKDTLLRDVNDYDSNNKRISITIPQFRYIFNKLLDSYRFECNFYRGSYSELKDNIKNGIIYNNPINYYNWTIHKYSSLELDNPSSIFNDEELNIFEIINNQSLIKTEHNLTREKIKVTQLNLIKLKNMKPSANLFKTTQKLSLALSLKETQENITLAELITKHKHLEKYITGESLLDDHLIHELYEYLNTIYHLF